MQDLGRDAPREIEGTEGSRGQIFWSPGSDFIGFTTTQDVKKVPVEGGPVAVLCQLPPGDPSGGAWSPDGDSIIFGSVAEARPNLCSSRRRLRKQESLLTRTSSLSRRVRACCYSG